MPESRTRRLQQAMATLVIDGDEAALGADPGLAAGQHGLSAEDQQTFRDQAEGMLTYRELARASLIEPLETMYPVLKSLLERDGAWEGCVQAFLEARVLRSPHYRDIAPSFLGWLAQTQWGQDRWPFLLELAHAEILETLVARYPDSEPPGGLHIDPEPQLMVALGAASQIVSYTHAVHRVDEQAPVPEARPTHLIAFRDEAGSVRLLELTPATAALLTRARTQSLAEAAEALGLPDLAPAMALLRDLRRDGAIAGFATPT